MTAVHTPSAINPQRRSAASTRPSLRVIEGGRSAGALRAARTYRRRRALVAMTGLLVGWLLISALAAGAGALSDRVLGSDRGTSPAPSSAVSGGGAAATRYTVRSGDTLWSVAQSLHVGGDVRDVMAELADENGDGVLHPGQVLVVPADLTA